MFKSYLLQHLVYESGVLFKNFPDHLVKELVFSEQGLVSARDLSRGEEELLKELCIVDKCRGVLRLLLILFYETRQRQYTIIHLILTFHIHLIQIKPHSRNNQPPQHPSLIQLNSITNSLRLHPQLELHQKVIIDRIEYLLSSKHIFIASLSIILQLL